LTQDINGLDSGSAIPSTRKEDFYALQASVPPQSIQDSIVDHLDALNDKIELNRRMNARQWNGSTQRERRPRCSRPVAQIVPPH